MGKFGTNAPREGTSCVWGVGKKASVKLRQNVVKYEQRKRRFLWLLKGLAKHSAVRRGGGWGYGPLASIDSLSIVSATDGLLK